MVLLVLEKALANKRNSQAPPRGFSVGFGVSPYCHRSHEIFVLG